MIKVFDLDNFANKNFILYKRAKFGDSTKNDSTKIWIFERY